MMLTSAWSGWSRGTWRRNRRFGAEYCKKIVRARRCLRSVPADEVDRNRDLVSFYNVVYNLVIPSVLTYDVSAISKQDQDFISSMSCRQAISAELPGDHELFVDTYFSDIMASFRNEMTT
jgi:hypothetical protein